MRAKLTSTLLKEIKPKAKPFEIRDTEIRGLILRVQPTGGMSYICQYTRTKRITIGKAGSITLWQARDKARQLVAESVLGGDPMAKRKAERAHTLESFVTERYRPFAEANQTSARETLRRIAAYFPEFGTRRLSEITAWMIEKHRTQRLKSDISPSTVNRDLDSLRGAFSKAIEWGLLKTHPMAAVKNSRVDALERVRYLSSDEEIRLRDALEKREARRRQDRENWNSWRRERGYQEVPSYGTFTDHLKPIILLALNTGLRRGELFNLRIEHVDFTNRIVTVAGRTAKSKRTRHIPLNDEAFETLRSWRQDRSSDAYVFPGPGGSRMKSIKTSWQRLIRSAGIRDFVFHDLRHDFASKLAMNGEDLNTIRELLGHSDIKMTLRYAHLAPEHKRAAVASLGQGR